MRKAWTIWGAALGAALAGPAYAQEGPPAPRKAPAEDEELTPERAMEMLRETHQLMQLAEELLNGSAQGKALETEEALLARLKELLKEEPPAGAGDAQKKAIQKIERLMQKSEGSQQGALERLAEIIRKAKPCANGACKQHQPQSGPQPQPTPQPNRPREPGDPAREPYDPNRTGEPINKFRSTADRTGRWGDLPPRVREAILSGKRDLDEFPPEFQQVLKEYMKKLAEQKE
ncbi:MAG TPA: hypothetical protein VNO22_00535 [Planctomycetota bacterium]|jgi:hypothetical protein|nr:hypothetical protein [Planctomycetota bacterium]